MRRSVSFVLFLIVLSTASNGNDRAVVVEVNIPQQNETQIASSVGDDCQQVNFEEHPRDIAMTNNVIGFATNSSLVSSLRQYPI